MIIFQATPVSSTQKCRRASTAQSTCTRHKSTSRCAPSPTRHASRNTALNTSKSSFGQRRSLSKVCNLKNFKLISNHIKFDQRSIKKWSKLTGKFKKITFFSSIFFWIWQKSIENDLKVPGNWQNWPEQFEKYFFEKYHEIDKNQVYMTQN